MTQPQTEPAPARGPKNAPVSSFPEGPGSGRDLRWLLAVVGFIALHFSHPLVWHRPVPGWWFPPLGFGLVLVAWLGPRAALLVAFDTLLVAFQARLTNAPTLWDGPWEALFAAVWEATTLSGEVLAAWAFYHYVGKGTRRLGEPRSATLFVLIVPILVVAAFSALHALPHALIHPEKRGFLPVFLDGVRYFWLSHALGILTVAPPLLATFTPWLERHRLALTELPLNDRDEVSPGPLTGQDLLEVAGLATGVGTFEGLAALLYILKELQKQHAPNILAPNIQVPDVQLWGLPLIVIVWTSLRQGIRGGTVVAATALGVPLLLLGYVPHSLEPNWFWQLNFLAQGTAALLVSAAADWIRLSHARYRQVVTRIPMLLYSARVTHAPRDRRAPPEAELTFVSPAAQSLLGIEADLLLGDFARWIERVHPDDREILLAAVTQLGRQREPVTCEYRLAPVAQTNGATDDVGIVAAGSRVFAVPRMRPRERWVRDTMAPQYGPTGDLQGWDGVIGDITEQRVLSDDLRRTTSMFHALVANLPAGVFFVQGEAGLPILVNARARQLLGQHEDPSAGLARLVRTYRLCRPDGTPYPTEELPVVQALRRGATSMRDDIVVHRPDGQQIPLIAWAAPVDLGGHGRPDAAVWVFEDLTALHQAEAARRESEARLRTVIETMVEGVIVVDEQGVVIECNPAASTILRISPDRLRGPLLLDQSRHYVREDGSPLPPEEHPALVSLRSFAPVRNVVIGTMAEPGVEGAEEARWVMVSAMPLPGPRRTGHGARVVATFADVTAHRRALDVVRASEEKYRELVETLPILLIQFDRAGRVVYMNPTAEAFTGFRLEELNDRERWHSMIWPQDWPQMREAFAQALVGETARFETRYRVKDGTEKVGFVFSEPRHQDGAVIGVTALIVDMTRERKLEQELQRAQRLELIGRVSSGIAHDFNNFLTVVLTLSELLRHGLPPEDPMQDDLRKIIQAGEQAANLANQLLTFGKQRRVEPRRVDVNRVATRTLELLRATLPRGIQVEAVLAEGEMPVQSDEMQLQQVLMNLCLNARDAMPNGGCLEVRTSAVTVAENGTTGDSGRWILLSVKDNGEGIPQEMLGQIFEAFYTTKERGTGLGLAMVRQIIESNGGRVEVSSRQGEGARFDVWLPLKDEG